MSLSSSGNMTGCAVSNVAGTGSSTLVPGPIWVVWASMTLLPQSQVVRCYAQDKRVYATVDGGTVYLLRERLYELEEQLDRGKFVRISNGEIINLDKVTAVDLSLTGTIRMTLGEAGYAYVSRRYVKKIKEALQLERRRTR